MKNTVLWTIVLVLAFIQGLNFYLAPHDIASLMKQDLGATKVYNVALENYKQGGQMGLERFCGQHDPIESRGFYYRCGYGHDPSDNRLQIYVGYYSDLTAARDYYPPTFMRAEKIPVDLIRFIQ